MRRAACRGGGGCGGGSGALVIEETVRQPCAVLNDVMYHFYMAVSICEHDLELHLELELGRGVQARRPSSPPPSRCMSAPPVPPVDPEIGSSNGAAPHGSR